MKYEIAVTIEKPLDETIRKLDNIKNLKHWQKGLESVEHLGGTPGEVGAQTKLNYKFGKRNMTLTETITKRDLPHEFHATYEAPKMTSIQKNFFSENDQGHTIWTSRSEFKPQGLFLTLMSLIAPGMFKKQSRQYMADFKNFVEHNISIADD